MYKRRFTKLAGLPFGLASCCGSPPPHVYHLLTAQVLIYYQCFKEHLKLHSRYARTPKLISKMLKNITHDMTTERAAFIYKALSIMS